MKLCFGLDVSPEKTAICVISEYEKIVREAQAASDPEAPTQWMGEQGGNIAVIGFEAGPLSAMSRTRFTKAGDVNRRRTLCQAATVMMHRGRSTWLRTWAAQVDPNGAVDMR